MTIWQAMLASLALLLALITQGQRDAGLQVRERAALAVGDSIRVYHSVLQTYVQQHPGAAGQIPDDQLQLPAWFRNTYSLQNLVSGGKAYTFYVPRAPRPPLEALGLGDNGDVSLLFGIARNGALANPHSPTPTIPLPAAIPEGSVVYAS